ncbi:MAG: GHKL domain-containing protein [Chlamydiae bacterium]|nr:GHKL domain-containing protein [Chlamydiota bacterium]MBI3277845.1 GHKL domain-containing protein [Chlamydiota bacterium]
METKNRQIRRILIVEKMIMMPIKAALLFFSFLFFGSGSQDTTHLFSKSFLFYQAGLYLMANAIFFVVLTWAQARKWGDLSIKTAAFFLSIIDNLYLSFLIPLTGGLESPIYWFYTGLMIRNAINFPKIRVQGIINLAFCIFYAGAVYVGERETELFLQEIFYLRIIVLLLVSICCWGIYALIQQRVLKDEEEREFHLRREKIHAIRRLAGEIAHGLKNPLTIINNAAYYLEKHVTDELSDVKQHVTIIREEIHRSDRILSQIMDYSKWSNAKLTKLNINQVLDSAIHEIHPETTFPNIHIKKQYQKDLPFLFFDEGHLRQIFSNLIINAFEAIQEKGEGQGLITLTSSLDEENETLLVSVSDTGVGMDLPDVNKIYDPFFTTKEKGTGLGLSIVKNLIETYDGSVEVESKKERGSTFTIRLPIATKNQR